MPKVIEAKLSGTCAICHKQYSIGTRIAKHFDKWAEADCIWRNHTKDNANSSSLVGESQPIHPTKDTSIEHLVRQRYKLSIQIAKDEISNIESYSEYPFLIAEILRQLGAEEMAIKIQENKEKNMKAIR